MGFPIFFPFTISVKTLEEFCTFPVTNLFKHVNPVFQHSRLSFSNLRSRGFPNPCAHLLATSGSDCISLSLLIQRRDYLW